MSLCQSIDTLAMAYLDDELVSEERRELELHLLSCGTCKHHVESERAEIDLVRVALTPPPAPASLKASITGLLDAEDRQATRAVRQRWTKFALPGGAALAAAAALVVFVAAQRPEAPAATATSARVAREAVRVQSRQLPYDVRGPDTNQWTQQRFSADISPPQFSEPGVELLGGREVLIDGRDAVLLRYLVGLESNRYTLNAFMIRDLNEETFSGGTPIKIGNNRTLRMHNAGGTPLITYVDRSSNGTWIGYVFSAERLTMDELLAVVVSWNLIGRVQQGG